MARIDTTLAILDARRHIVGGYVVPFLTRELDGKFHSRQSQIAFTRDPLPIYCDHIFSEGVCGLGAVELRSAGYYATVQLYANPHSAWYQEHITKGQIAFSYDAHKDGFRADGDGHIPSVRIFGASLTAWPYMRPNYIASAEQYMTAINRYCAEYGDTMKFIDPVLERMPIPARYENVSIITG